MYRYEALDRYLNDVSLNTPTPGGGSVSALVAALSTSLATMSANFTLGKRKFKNVEPKIREILEKCSNDREELMRLMEEDIEAYNGVDRAYALSQSNEEEKKHRTSAIQSALEKAMVVPLKIVRCSLGLLEYTNGLVTIANPNLVTDVGVAGLLANAALKGAMLNVEINLNCIQSKEVVNTVKEEIEKTLVRAEKLIDDIMKKVKDIMNK